MEVFAVFIVTFLFTLGSVAIGYTVWQVLALKKTLELQLTNVEKMIGFIAKDHQLATIFDIKSAALSVSPEQFYAKKEVLLANINHQMETCRNEDPSTWAFVVVYYSGLESFIERSMRNRLQEAVARLRANQDIDGVRNLLKDVVDQLEAPAPWRALDPTPNG